MSRLWQVFAAELRREVRYQQSYAVEYVAGVLLYAVGFLLLTGVFALLARGAFDARDYAMALVGFLSWRVADRGVVRANRSLAQDAQWGTLEQWWLSGLSPLWLQMNRVLSVLLVYLPTAVAIGGIVTLMLGLRPHFSPALAPVFLLTMAGAAGLSLLLSGLQLVYKNVDFLAFALSSALLFTTGAWAPIANAPLFWQLSRLLPLSSGISLMQQMVADGTPLWALMGRPDWPLLWLNTAGYLAAGVLVLLWGQRTSRQHGTLGQY